MTATASTSTSAQDVAVAIPNSNATRKVDLHIRPFNRHVGSSSGSSNDSTNNDELAQIRSLFVSGMEDNNAPQDYIQRSLKSDLNSVQSMEETYFSGRGTYLLLVEEHAEREDGEDGGEDNASTSCVDNKANRTSRVVGMVGLQDISHTTGTSRVNARRQTTNNDKTHDNLCELRRMSILPTRRRGGYGAKLIKAGVEHAKTKGFDGIKLYTGGWMVAAINFYIKMGFVDKGRLDYRNDDGSTVTIAHLELLFE